MHVGHPDQSKPVLLKASKYRVCGAIKQEEAVKRPLVIKGSQGQELVETSQDGVFCRKLAPGEYKLTPKLTETETKQGYLFSPATKTVKVEERPLEGLKFE